MGDEGKTQPPKTRPQNKIPDVYRANSNLPPANYHVRHGDYDVEK